MIKSRPDYDERFIRREISAGLVVGDGRFTLETFEALPSPFLRVIVSSRLIFSQKRKT